MYKPRYEFLVLLNDDVNDWFEFSVNKLLHVYCLFYQFASSRKYCHGRRCQLRPPAIFASQRGNDQQIWSPLAGYEMLFKCCCELVAPRSQLCFCSATQLALDFPSYHLFDCFRQQVSWMSLPANRSKVEGDHLLQPWEEFWVVHQPLLLERGYKLRNRYDPNWVPSWYGKKKNQIIRCSDILCIPVSNIPRSITTQYLFRARSMFLPISPIK